MTKKYMVIVGIILCVAASGAGILTAVRKAPNYASNRQPVSGGSGSLPAHIDDDRYLMGMSHYVFVGKVHTKTGSDFMVDVLPSALYEVEVILNIKGILQGNVTIAQLGITHYRNGRLYSIFGDNPLQPGATYLFATRYLVKDNMYAISGPPYDRKLMTSDSGLSNAQLKELALKDERVRALQAAYPNEILSRNDDINGGTAWNNYKSFQSGHLFAPPPFVESNPSDAPATESSGPASEPTASVSPSISP